MPLALTGYEVGLLSAALVFIAFALVVALVIPRRWPDFPARGLGWFIAAAIALFAIQMTAVFLLAELGGEEHAAAETGPTGTEPTTTEPAPTEPAPTEPTPTETTETTATTPTETTETTATTPTETTETTTTETGPGGQGDPVAGKEIFMSLAQPQCGSCHTLADAGTTGAIGPNLDAAHPSFDKVVERVTEGQGVMPAFGDSLTEQQIRDVAAYVSSAAGG